MTNRNDALRRDPTFEAFLGASVGEDSVGTSISVLSMLARLGVDPWDEATSLARMQTGAAQTRLTGLIGTFSDLKTIVGTQSETAQRLVAFLPSATAAKQAMPAANPKSVPQLKIGAPVYLGVGIAIVVGWFAWLAQGF